MLCRHLGFTETGVDEIELKTFYTGNILTGDYMCYNIQSNRTSCCIHLVPYKITSATQMPYVRCEYGMMCKKRT